MGRRRTYLITDWREEKNKREGVHQVKGQGSPSNPDEQGEVKGEGNMDAK